jgi:hypothetical protein
MVVVAWALKNISFLYAKAIDPLRTMVCTLKNI